MIPVAETVENSLPVQRFSLRLPGPLTRHNFPLWVGAGIVAAVLLLVFVGPLFVSQSPTAQDLANAFAAPSASHPLGTDQLGRDVLARLLLGGRIDLSIAFFAVMIPFILGSLLGALAGWFGGWVDAVVMRTADLVSAFPFYVLIIALVFVVGNGAVGIFIAISAVAWVSYARIVRAETLVLRESEFVAACRASGLPAARIIARHIIPNALTPAIVFSVSDVVLGIGTIVTLSYFGLGIVPPTPDWGQMMNDGQQYLAAGRYELTLLPGGIVVIVSFGLALLGDGLARFLKGKG